MTPCLAEKNSASAHTLSVIDCLTAALAGRITVYKDVYLRFKAVVDPFSLSDVDSQRI